MSFEARYVPIDNAPLDEHGELLLPDDLADLAAQLTDDAARLSQTFPAHNQPLLEMHPKHSRTRWGLSFTVVASLLFAASLGMWSFLQVESPFIAKDGPALGPLMVAHYANGENDPMSGNASDLYAWSGEYDHRKGTGSHDPVFEPSTWSVIDSAAIESATESHFILHEFSGAELEGLYDLMEPPQSAIEF